MKKWKMKVWRLAGWPASDSASQPASQPASLQTFKFHFFSIRTMVFSTILSFLSVVSVSPYVFLRQKAYKTIGHKLNKWNKTKRCWENHWTKTKKTKMWRSGGWLADWIASWPASQPASFHTFKFQFVHLFQRF